MQIDAALKKEISIHAPLTGSDVVSTIAMLDAVVFQSTLPSQGATTVWGGSTALQIISIHAPLTGSDQFDMVLNKCYIISIHAPLTGSDYNG